MSGYRSLHRHRAIPKDENDDPGCVWDVAAVPWHLTPSRPPPSSSSQSQSPNNTFRLFVVGSTDSDVRSLLVEESSLENGGETTSSSLLDASAARVALTHVLVDQADPSRNRHRQQAALAPSRSDHPPPLLTNPDQDDNPMTVHQTSAASVGCARVYVTRNYVGQDDAAGNLIVVTLDLVGTLRVWELDATTLNNDNDDEKRHTTSAVPPSSKEGADIVVAVAPRIPARHQTVLLDATGTTLALCRPPIEGPVCVAVGCLDGSVRLVATGLVTPTYGAEPSPPIGTIVRSWGGRGSALPLALCWKPDTGGGANDGCLAVGRQDGTIDLVPVEWGVERTTRRAPTHRLVQHTTPVRAVAYTPDGALLLSGSDEGLVCVWDANRGSAGAATAARSSAVVPPLVHHLWCGNSGNATTATGGDWILQIWPLPDARRFAVATQANQILVWDLEHPHQVSHTFETEAPCYAGTVVVVAAAAGPQHQQQRHRPTRRLVTGNDAGWVQLYSVE